MDILRQSETETEFGSNKFTEGIVVLAIAGSGLALMLGGFREYGIQAWYRMAVWLGFLLAVSGAAYYVLLMPNDRVLLQLRQRRLLIRRRQGLRVVKEIALSLDEIRDAQIEKSRSRSGQAHYRVSVLHRGEWIPLTRSSSGDLNRVQRSGAQLAALAGIGTQAG
jgi:hypothetical protein